MSAKELIKCGFKFFKLLVIFKVALNAHYKFFLNFAKICIVLCLSQFGNEKLRSPSSFLSYKDFKLN